MGSLCLPGTTVAMRVTVENALDQIWGVRRNRPFVKRVGGRRVDGPGGVSAA